MTIQYVRGDLEATRALSQHSKLQSMQRQREILDLPFRVRFEKARVSLKVAHLSWLQARNKKLLAYYHHIHKTNARKSLFKAWWLIFGKVSPHMTLEQIPDV